MDPRLDAFIRAQSDEASSLTEKQRKALHPSSPFTPVQLGEQLTLAQDQQNSFQAFWWYAKQEFKHIAEKLQSILQPHLLRKEAMKSQRMNQQLIFYLESQSPPWAGGPDILGCMVDIAADLYDLLTAITKATGRHSEERQPIREALDEMENAETRMYQLETDCTVHALRIAGSITRLSEILGDSYTVPVQSLTNSELKKRVIDKRFKV
jgi:hypothetical protein